MTTHAPRSGEEPLRDPTDFSLVLGGPLFQILRRAHLSDDALTLLRRRVLVVSLLAWLPSPGPLRARRTDAGRVPTHPDRAGGLGFLSSVLYAFIPLAAAFGAALAAPLADHIFYSGARLPEFKMQIAATVALLVLLFIGPLLVFVPRMARAKRTGLLEYGALAQRYVREFDAKWLRGHAPPDEPLVASGDVQSLADLANSFEVVRTMRVAPIAMQDVLLLAIAALVPIAPLLLTVMPLEELLKLVLGLLR
jgi:hypothetical protein